ncbi:MAG: hypothetical protein FD144_1649 [Rhodospirillaceae bacterium]|nr:MAG: hypothetical protein FD144_1649 [Rhodospirillaceae bacterium]
MKQGVVFTLASSVLFAAGAAAHFMAPLPGAASFPSSAQATPASGPPSPVAKTIGEGAVSKPLVEARQAPVPLQMRQRPPAVLSQTLEAAGGAMPAAAAPSNVEGADFARSAIEADGYRSVKNVVAGPGGTWQARAFRGKTEVVLRVDREGNVSAD